jgi:SAM-dependent methyltransferase
MSDMNITIVGGGSAMQKAQGIVRTYPSIWKGTVIDVGCRTRELGAALRGRHVRYVGVDVDPSAEIVADLGEKLPFDDDAADVVVALDVLEHTDDIHRAFGELCRVAREHIVITLPNCFEAGIRLRLMRGKPIGQKYGLPLTKPDDRHRWFFSLDDARQFVHGCAAGQEWKVVDERAIVGPRRRRLAYAVKRWPNLLSPTYLALLTRR